MPSPKFFHNIQTYNIIRITLVGVTIYYESHILLTGGNECP